MSTVASPVSSGTGPNRCQPRSGECLGGPTTHPWQSLAYWASQHGGGTANTAAIERRMAGQPDRLVIRQQAAQFNQERYSLLTVLTLRLRLGAPQQA